MAEGVRYVIVLIREADGEIVALVDAAYLTAPVPVRPVVSPLDTSRDDATDIGLLGSGTRSRDEFGGHRRRTPRVERAGVQPEP